MDDLEPTKKVTISELMDEHFPDSVSSLGEYTVKGLDGAKPEQGHYGEMTTVIDRVYDYIMKREMTSIQELSDRLGIKKHQVEKMVEMLETSKLIQLRYSVVPNGRIEVLVLNKDHERLPREITHEEKVKRLKKTVLHDVERLENALSSMEHHLNLWSSDVEERTASGKEKREIVTQVNEESTKIEKTLEHVRVDMSSRISSIKKRLSDMRGKINEKPASGAPGSGAGLFGIKNPFNF